MSNWLVKGWQKIAGQQRVMLQQSRLRPSQPAWIVLVISLVVTLFIFSVARHLMYEKAKERFSFRVRDLASAIDNRMSNYLQVLRGGVGLFAGSGIVDSDEWRNFTSQLRVRETKDGIHALGYATYVKNQDERTWFTQNMKNAGFKDFAIFPSGERDFYTIVTYLEYFGADFKAPYGFDMSSEITRRTAIERARDTGEAAMSGPVVLVKTQQGVPDRPGFVTYLPVYSGGKVPPTIEERRELIQGLVYGPFVSAHVMDAVIANVHDVSFLISDRSRSGQMVPIYTKVSEDLDEQLRETLTIPIAGREWVLQVTADRRFISNEERAQPYVILVALLMVDALLYYLIRSVTSREQRSQELADERTRELRESWSRYELIVQGAIEGIWDWDMEKGSIHLSHRWNELIGYAIDELPNSPKELMKLIHPSDREPLELAIRDSLTEGRGVFEAEFRGRGKQSAYAWFHVRGAILRSAEGRPIRMAGSVSDISERKAFIQEILASKEQALAATRIKSQFIANMSHEIRTPLNAVMGLTDILRDSSLGREQLDCVDGIQQNASNLLHLVSDILDFSKIEAGKMVLEQIPVELPRLLRELERSLGFFAEKKNLSMTLSVGEGVPRHIMGDPWRITQVLTNLLSNAIKFTEKGSVSLDVTRTPENRLRFVVKDSGIGISPEAAPRLFQAFQQADATTTRRFGGTGLGLSIAQELVKRMGGEIQLTSQMGQGSEFYFELPLLIAHVHAPIQAEEGAEAEFAGSRVLLAEDNIVNVKIALFHLQKLGIEADVARDGQEAVTAAASQIYDLIIMDCLMPEMDGYEATAILRQSPDPRLARLPIIAVTANAFAEDQERCLAVGMNDYLTKPLRLDELRAALARWLPPRDSSKV